MNRGDLRFIAVGDVHPNREHPDEVFQPVADIFATGNLRYCQVECTFSSAGSLRTDVRNPAHRVPPYNVKALRAAAFDVASFASNNALDYGVEPFVETIDRMTQEGITVVGAGRNLAEARRPGFVERNGVRMAFVNACSLLRDGYAATSQRPGIAPLYVRTSYEPLENIYEQPGTPARTWTVPDHNDLAAVLADIREAKQQADLVVACFHWGIHFTHDLAMYQPEVGYAAIDAGADLVIGTHPHCLQAFDVYKGKVIAYSLGNFVFEQDPGTSHQGVGEYLSFYGIPVDRETPRVPHPKHTKLTGLLVCDISDRRISRVSFRPALIDRDARPRLLTPQEEKFNEIARLLSDLSGELGLELSLHDSELEVPFEKSEPRDTRALLRRRKISYPSLRWLAMLNE